MKLDKLIRMANQIAANLDYGADQEQAAKATADHLRRFWEPRMRAEIVEHLRAGAQGLSPVARRAVEQLAERQPA